MENIKIKKIDERIQNEGVDGEEIAKIAEGLKNKGLFTAGADLNQEAARIYREKLIDKETKKQ